MTAALVPVKPLAAGKSRLAASLGRAAAETLLLAMLEDVIAALRSVGRIGLVAVVTPDPAVANAARKAGAEPMLEPDPGLNASVERAGAALAERAGPGAALLVVLGDVAGARPADLAALLDALDAQGGRGVVLAPSCDGGTSALLRSPPDAIPACFGPQSAARHRERAERAGLAVRVLPLPSLAIDLDSEDDLRRFVAGPGDGAHTRAVLRAIGVGASA